MDLILSKLFWVFASPGNFLALLLVAGAFMASSHEAGVAKAGRRMCFTVALLFFLIGIFPVGSWLVMPLENSLPPQSPQHVAGIILIGGDEKPLAEDDTSRPIFLDSARRYIEFASLARKYPDAKLVFSGGSPALSPKPDMKEATTVRHVLAGLGMPVDKMIFEDRSRNTHENAVMSYDLVHPKAEETWLLVTSAFHMPRALLTFQKAGWNIAPATTGYFTDGTVATKLQFNVAEHLMVMAWAVHEYVGLIEYRVLGYTDRLWPN